MILSHRQLQLIFYQLTNVMPGMGSRSRIFLEPEPHEKKTRVGAAQQTKKQEPEPEQEKKYSALKPWYILYCMRNSLLPDIPRDFFAEFSAAVAALSKHSLIPCSGKMHLIIQNIFSRKSIVFIDVFNLISNTNGNMVKKSLGFTACSKIRFCMDVMIILQDNQKCTAFNVKLSVRR